jgi:hypothetical protein
MKVFLHAVLFFACTGLFAQTLPGGLNQSQSRQWLKDNWYTGKHKELSYDSARIYMYGFIDNYGDSIECVYSGYKKKLVFGTNNVTFPSPINCEHTVPQAFFDSELPMLSDIYHMFPTYEQWNNDRANYPFSDINDAQTNKWIYKATSQAGQPSSNKDLYSEYKTNTTFEPREQHKGNLARAVFYFFTMYDPASNDITDVSAINTLCLWAKNDPPNGREIERNNRIQQYQGNRNPYVDHPEWLMQAWGCPDIPAGLRENTVAEPLKVYPNPAGKSLFIEIDKKFIGGELVVYSILGREIARQLVVLSGTKALDIQAWERGYYLLTLRSVDGQASGEAIFTKE